MQRLPRISTVRRCRFHARTNVHAWRSSRTIFTSSASETSSSGSSEFARKDLHGVRKAVFSPMRRPMGSSSELSIAAAVLISLLSAFELFHQPLSYSIRLAPNCQQLFCGSDRVTCLPVATKKRLTSAKGFYKQIRSLIIQRVMNAEAIQLHLARFT